MARAYGSDAILLTKTEDSYGVAPAGDYDRRPFFTTSLGSEQGLETDPRLLGLGREPPQPQRGVITAGGDLVLPVDLRNFVFWLEMLLGDPVKTDVQATGNFTFSGQPADNATITLNGVAWTFVTGTPSGNQTQIGGTLAATLAQLATDLNASADAELSKVTYTATATALQLTFDTGGAAGAIGNAFTLAASTAPDSKATRSGATLTGGGVQRVYTSGADTLPSFTAEIGHPKVPFYDLVTGAMANTAQFQWQRSGTAQATFGVIAQTSQRKTTSSGGTPVSAALTQFSQFNSAIRRGGLPLGNSASATLTYSNGLVAVENIRPDGLIDGIDPGPVRASGELRLRFADRTLYDAASDGTPVAVEFGYLLPVGTLLLALPTVYLPKPKLPIQGPGGIEATYAFEASGESGPCLTATLINDVA